MAQTSETSPQSVLASTFRDLVSIVGPTVVDPFGQKRVFTGVMFDGRDAGNFSPVIKIEAADVGMEVDPKAIYPYKRGNLEVYTISPANNQLTTGETPDTIYTVLSVDISKTGFTSRRKFFVLGSDGATQTWECNLKDFSKKRASRPIPLKGRGNDVDLWTKVLASVKNNTTKPAPLSPRLTRNIKIV